MVGRRYLELTVKAPKKSRRHATFFLKKYIKMIYAQKMKNGFFGNYYAKWKVGTWSTSSLIPRREDIIPRWSQLLTPIFNKRNIRPRGGKIVLFKYFGLKIIVQKWRNGLKSSQVSKILGCDRKKEPIHGWYSLCLSKHARRIAEVRTFSCLRKSRVTNWSGDDLRFITNPQGESAS